MGWPILSKLLVDPADNDSVPFDQGGIVRRTTWIKLKNYILGTATLTTTDKTMRGSVNEINASLSENVQEIAKKIDKTSIANNLTTTLAGSVLDAAQGKILKNTLDAKVDLHSKGLQTQVVNGSATYFDATGLGFGVLEINGSDLEMMKIFSLCVFNEYASKISLIQEMNFGGNSVNVIINFPSENGYVISVTNNTGAVINCAWRKISLLEYLNTH